MKVLYFDCSSGISGNMTLGALSELIDDPHYLVNELKKLNVDGYHIHISKEKKNGITGTYVDVHLEHEHHHDHEHEGEALEYGISTFVWQTRKPLDLKKFTNLLNNYPNVIRTKGYVWFDNQPDSAYLFEQAGKLTSLQEDSLWIASAPKQDQIDLLKANPQLAQNWDEEYGDRINQLVFIGKNMDEEQIKRQFNDCLA